MSFEVKRSRFAPIPMAEPPITERETPLQADHAMVWNLIRSQAWRNGTARIPLRQVNASAMIAILTAEDWDQYVTFTLSKRYLVLTLRQAIPGNLLWRTDQAIRPSTFPVGERIQGTVAVGTGAKWRGSIGSSSEYVRTSAHGSRCTNHAKCGCVKCYGAGLA